jgi:HSP20 family protein
MKSATNMVRYSPFREVDRLQDEMNRLFSGWTRGWADGEPDSTTLWAPLVDIFEDEEAVTLKAELPGVDPKSVDIRLENNVLTLKGERKYDGDPEKENVLRMERPYGNFSRSFSISSVVDDSKITAKFDSGVLTVTLPKKEQAKPKRIQIAA